MCRRGHAFGWSFHQENERNHHKSRKAKKPEIVEVRDHGRLSQNEPVELPIRLVLGGDGTTRGEVLAHVLHGVIELAAVRRGVRRQCGLMELRPARQHCGDEGNTHACPDVAR